MSIEIVKVGIGGAAGTGKSVLLIRLARHLGYPSFSAGDANRSARRRRGFVNDQAAWEEFLKGNEVVDRTIDERFRKFFEVNDEAVGEGRLVFEAQPKAPNARRILLICSNFNERCLRIVGRSGRSIEEVKAETLSREKSIRLRYKKLYGIENCFDPAHFDRVIDTMQGDENWVFGQACQIVGVDP